jgi:peroxiredoxin Q/BCP
MQLQVGVPAPNFFLPDQFGKVHKLSDYKGQWVLIYFYPKDNTLGCTKEACNIRDHFSDFEKQKVVVIGISVDSSESHAKFAKKHELPFILLSDSEKNVVERYGVWGVKKFLGKKFFGTYRTSYLINPAGKIFRIYDRVKPQLHAQEVLKDLETLKNA